MRRLKFRRLDSKSPKLVVAGVTSGIVIAIGSILLLTHAAGFFAATEAENGTKSANAVAVADTTASGGSAVKFNEGSGSSGCTGMAPVTHGQQITTANTGYLAWCGSDNQTCTDAQLYVYASEVTASKVKSDGKTTCVWLKGGINIDADITLTACRIDDQVSTYPAFKTLSLNYCTIAPPTATGTWPYSLGPDTFSATRCQIGGSMDGVNWGGGTHKNVLIENYIRTKMRDPDDHNDGVQSYFSSGGGTILRNNIDGNTVGGGGGPNSAIFLADDTEGEFEIRDNYLAGGGYTMGLHESSTYRVTGNIIAKNSYLFGPINTVNAVSGAFLEWSNNKLSDGTVLSP
jgi:hypothetical protein